MLEELDTKRKEAIEKSKTNLSDLIAQYKTEISNEAARLNQGAATDYADNQTGPARSAYLNRLVKAPDNTATENYYKTLSDTSAINSENSMLDMRYQNYLANIPKASSGYYYGGAGDTAGEEDDSAFKGLVDTAMSLYRSTLRRAAGRGSVNVAGYIGQLADNAGLSSDEKRALQNIATSGNYGRLGNDGASR